MNIAPETKRLFGTLRKGAPKTGMLRKGTLRKILSDQRGQVTIEYTLVLVAFGLPMATTFVWLGRLLTEYYRMITFIETLPFP